MSRDAHISDDPVSCKSSLSIKEKLWDAWSSYCCFAPEDDFAQILRKTSASVNILMAPAPFLFGAYFVILGYFSDTEGEDAQRTLQITCFVLITWAMQAATPYIYLRINRHISTRFVDVHMAAGIVYSIVCNVLWSSLSTQGLGVAMAIMSVLSQTKYVLVHCIFIGLFYLHNTYNQAYSETPHTLAIPGARIGPPFERLIMVIAVETIVGLAIGGVFAQSVAHIKHVAASRTAVKMSRRVVNLLRRYNTDGVTEALVEYEQSAVDPDLVKSLKMMNSNLETYKPFLPNYLFQDIEVSDVESDVLDSDDEGSLSDSSSQSTTKTAVSSSAPTLKSWDNSVKSSLVSCSSASYLNAPESGSSTKSVYEGSISVALVEVPELHGSNDAMRASSFVECIFDAAEMSKGSVHSLVGDVATITWNVTHRVAQPEMKAAKFLNHLKLSQTTRFGSVAFSGIASCYSVTSSKRQHADVISATWIPMLNTAFDLACEYKCTLIDEKTESVSSSCYISILVDTVGLCQHDENAVTSDSRPQPDTVPAMLITPQLSESPRLDFSPIHFSRAVGLFQLIREVELANEEWMYQLEMKDRKNNAAASVRESASEVFGLAMERLTGNTGKEKSPNCSCQVAATEVCRVLHELEAQEDEAALDINLAGIPTFVQLPLIQRLAEHMQTLSQA